MNIPAIYCPKTKELLYSRYRHDMRMSSDNLCSIDGGFSEYTQYSGEFMHCTLDSDVLLKQILYYDWSLGNRNADKFPEGYHGRFELVAHSSKAFYQDLIVQDENGQAVIKEIFGEA